MSKIFHPTSETQTRVLVQIRPDEVTMHLDGEEFDTEDLDEIEDLDNYVFGAAFVVRLLQQLGVAVELERIKVIEFDEDAPEWDALRDRRPFEPIGVKNAEVRLSWLAGAPKSLVYAFEIILHSLGAAKIVRV